MDGMIPPNPQRKQIEDLNPEPVALEDSTREYYERFASELEEQDWTLDPSPTHVWNQSNMRYPSLVPHLSSFQSGGANIQSHYSRLLHEHIFYPTNEQIPTAASTNVPAAQNNCSNTPAAHNRCYTNEEARVNSYYSQPNENTPKSRI
ncbi:hypothetical protein WDU94_000732 [Cyamophila willieti]